MPETFLVSNHNQYLFVRVYFPKCVRRSSHIKTAKDGNGSEQCEAKATDYKWAIHGGVPQGHFFTCADRSTGVPQEAGLNQQLQTPTRLRTAAVNTTSPGSPKKRSKHRCACGHLKTAYVWWVLEQLLRASGSKENIQK